MKGAYKHYEQIKTSNNQIYIKGNKTTDQICTRTIR